MYKMSDLTKNRLDYVALSFNLFNIIPPHYRIQPEGSWNGVEKHF